MTGPRAEDLDLPEAPIPVSVLTGFLGSGKTTVLNRLLAHPDTGETAVIVNEFGEIGLDHLLVESGGEDKAMFERTLKAFNEQGPGPLDPAAG